MLTIRYMSHVATAKLTHNEVIKAAIPTLAGTIAATNADANADHFNDDDNQFLKFHGSYQQDDRDLRKTGKKYMDFHQKLLNGRGQVDKARALAAHFQ